MQGTTSGDEDFEFYIETFSEGSPFSDSTFIYQDGSDISDAVDQFFNNFIFRILTLTVSDDTYFANEGSFENTGTNSEFTILGKLSTENRDVIPVSLESDYF